MAREYDGDGVPLDELFTNKEMGHLRFHQWLFRRRPEKRQPQTPLPKSEPKRNRGKGWGKPGI